MNVFVQAKAGAPFSPSAQIAALGISQRGWKIELVETLPQVSANTPLVGSVSWTEKALAQMGITLPDEDYPDALRGCLGRAVSPAILGPVLMDSSLRPLFLKPRKQKEFTGTALRGEEDLSKFSGLPLSTPVWTSPILDIVSEYRIYVMQGAVLACCRYFGEWSCFPDPATILEMIAQFDKAPQAYCLDAGILKSGKTVLIEATEILAASNYGLAPYLHSQMIETRWAELTRVAIPEFGYETTPPFFTR